LTDGSRSAVAEATAVLTTAQGIGAVLGALAIAPLAAALGRGRVLVGELVGLTFALVAYAFAPSLALAAVALTIVGAMYIGVLSGLQTVVQLRAPDAYRGRILSFYLVALGVVYPIGALIQGPLADRFGLPLTTTVFAVTLLAALAGIALFRSNTLRVLGEDRPDASVVPVIEPGAPPPGKPAQIVPSK
jgi:MFS family permease